MHSTWIISTQWRTAAPKVPSKPFFLTVPPFPCLSLCQVLHLCRALYFFLQIVYPFLLFFSSIFFFASSLLSFISFSPAVSSFPLLSFPLCRTNPLKTCRKTFSRLSHLVLDPPCPQSHPKLTWRATVRSV